MTVKSGEEIISRKSLRGKGVITKEEFVKRFIDKYCLIEEDKRKKFWLIDELANLKVVSMSFFTRNRK